MTVAASATNRTLELGCCSMGLFCTILQIGCHLLQGVPAAGAAHQHEVRPPVFHTTSSCPNKLS